MYEAEIIEDSITEHGHRLTTFVLEYPRIVHNEFMTHRMFSRNTSSSRAIPNECLIEKIKEDPVMPVWWGKNQSGMQAKEELTGQDLSLAKHAWLAARDVAILQAEFLAEVGVHKQIVNRLLEPWMWIKVICTATEYQNFFNLRCHPDAQPELQKVAYMMRDAYEEHTPKLLKPGEWHLPFVNETERAILPIDDQIKLSVARCARVSYLTHDGEHDTRKDIDLHQRLYDAPHLSPFEHQASPNFGADCRSGNFVGWEQYRQIIQRRLAFDTQEG